MLPVDPHNAEMVIAARAAVARGDWRAALAPLARLTGQSPDNGEFRLSLARARYLTGDYAGALEDYAMAMDLKATDPAVLAFGLAKCNARLKRTAEALKWLDVSVSLGLRRLEEARSDEAFEPLRKDAQFRRLVGLLDSPAPSRDEGWRGDIRFFAAWVEHKSYHPFKTDTADRSVSRAVYSRAEFDAQIRALLADVPNMSDRGVEIALFKLAAALGDGHTAIEGSRTRAEFALSLPLNFYVFQDGLYIIAASAKYAELVGAKVMALDGMPSESALRKIDPLIAHDNAQWVRAMEPTYLRHTPFLQELGIAKSEGTVVLELQMRDGSRKSAAVDADNANPLIWNSLPKPAGWRWIGDEGTADFQRDNDRPYWWRWHEASGVLYVQYNQVTDAKSQTLAQFAGELAAAIDRHPVAKLVIDMRNNNGGDTHLNDAMLGAITGSSKINRPGHLYVITGRRTFSAAMNAVSYFGRFTQAIFVGEPTGGKPNAPGDETFFTLPYSGIIVNLSDRYWQGGWPDDFSDWRAPDIAVPETFADYAAGHDAAMAAIEAQSLR